MESLIFTSAIGTVGLVLSIIASAILIGGATFGGFVLLRTSTRVKSTEASFALLVTANEGLRQANEDQKKRHDADISDVHLSMMAQEKKCSERVSNLEGQVAVLQDGIVSQVATAVGEKVLEVVTTALAVAVANGASSSTGTGAAK